MNTFARPTQWLIPVPLKIAKERETKLISAAYLAGVNDEFHHQANASTNLKEPTIDAIYFIAAIEQLP